MLASSPSGTDSHLVIHLKGCFALTVLHFGSDPDKPLNNIVSLANSGPVCRAFKEYAINHIKKAYNWS